MLAKSMAAPLAEDGNALPASCLILAAELWRRRAWGATNFTALSRQRSQRERRSRRAVRARSPLCKLERAGPPWAFLTSLKKRRRDLIGAGSAFDSGASIDVGSTFPRVSFLFLGPSINAGSSVVPGSPFDPPARIGLRGKAGHHFRPTTRPSHDGEPVASIPVWSDFALGCGIHVPHPVATAAIV